jgi:hypothetical protein
MQNELLVISNLTRPYFCQIGGILRASHVSKKSQKAELRKFIEKINLVTESFLVQVLFFDLTINRDAI